MFMIFHENIFDIRIFMIVDSRDVISVFSKGGKILTDFLGGGGKI